MREDDFRPVYCFKFIKVNTTDCHKTRCQYEILTIENTKLGKCSGRFTRQEAEMEVAEFKMLKDLHDEGQH